MNPFLRILLMLLAQPPRDDQIVEQPTAVQPRRLRHGYWYRSLDGIAYFHFLIAEQRRGSFLIYILSQPDYDDRHVGTHATHRIPSRHSYRGNRLHYICWSEDVMSVEEALAVCSLWAEKTWNYIRTGQQF